MRWPRLSAALLALALAAPLNASAQSSDGATGSMPAPAHVAIIVMENHAEASIIGNASASYLNSLAASYSYLDNYSAVAHPSLPNYLALAGGDTFGITSDCSRCYVNAPNLSDLLAGAGISGKAYMEDMPRPCFAGSAGQYALRHDPFMYFDDVRGDPTRCQAVVPYSQLQADMAAQQLPSFIWITPNVCHDMHDCDVATGDQWLSGIVPALLGSPAFSRQPSLLAIVWDEDDGSSGNRVPLILAGTAVKRGYVSHVPANHYSLLKTVEAAWNLPSLTANDATAQPITDPLVSNP
ncbi:MAG TPA: alkaline phosphatase family protein [Chloroflexota bacterium]|nr:alkaline phosphatase family protein [Chloroflexota bacterium]